MFPKPTVVANDDGTIVVNGIEIPKYQPGAMQRDLKEWVKLKNKVFYVEGDLNPQKSIIVKVIYEIQCVNGQGCRFTRVATQLHKIWIWWVEFGGWVRNMICLLLTSIVDSGLGRPIILHFYQRP